ncbi:D-alanine aminotransferase [alpha proteobacterium U9-1i]|nr:D-alanine aminotransferase [alpha proteobacterium U9-1i]
MRGVAYVNGAYLPLARAAVSIHDRGFLFGDAVYEVWAVRRGRLNDSAEHLARYNRSLRELKMRAPMSDRALMAVVRETMRRNDVREGIVYLQVSRGAAAERDHVFPAASVPPTLVLTAKNLSLANLAARMKSGVKIITTPETRWARCDIKSVNLLPNVLAKQAAKEAGAFEAWFVDREGFVTEGGSTTAWIVDAQGRLRTRDLSNRILHGVTRAVLLRLAQERQMPVVEAAFAPEDVRTAREAFVTSAGNPVVPVIAIDGSPIADGRPGPLAAELRDIYLGAQPV